MDIPSVNHAGILFNAAATADDGIASNAAAGIAIRIPCKQTAMICHASTPLKLPFAAAASI